MDLGWTWTPFNRKAEAMASRHMEMHPRGLHPALAHLGNFAGPDDPQLRS
jgi:hypothetical protein